MVQHIVVPLFASTIVFGLHAIAGGWRYYGIVAVTGHSTTDQHADGGVCLAPGGVCLSPPSVQSSGVHITQGSI